MTVKLIYPDAAAIVFNQIWLFIAESKKPLQFILKVAMETEIPSHNSFSYLLNKDCELTKMTAKS